MPIRYTFLAMSLLKDFKWVPPEIDILNVLGDSKLGYILEVDLEYHKELHDKHNLYPLAPEHVHSLMIALTFSAGTIFHRFVALYGNSFRIFTTRVIQE